MDFLGYIWTNWLYIPVFNALIWLYNGIAKENLGYAVILLTIGLRVFLLPLSVISEKNKVKYELLDKKVDVLKKDFKNDAVALKIKLRELFRKSQVNPWAKILVLAIQALMLVLLYQVFIGGLTRYKLNVLYPTIERPEIINTKFYGFELGIRDWRWAGAVGVILFLENYLEQRKRKTTKGEQLYAIFFPIMSFLLLWALPMVKSLFILTSLAFSYILSMFKGFFVSEKKLDKH
ncbi:MAG: YidC/Oxa1 family membrane protein insertase [Candidatus Magasanikbacteria bacterium]|nr:YidC/Oxa1 family membrane protein insertase [Candidatus Magasanikbacteria bacterium]